MLRGAAFGRNQHHLVAVGKVQERRRAPRPTLCASVREENRRCREADADPPTGGAHQIRVKMLTDVDGFYIPNGRKGQRLVRTVQKLTPEMEAVCNGRGHLGTGGMRSKLRAAKVASESGVHVAIVNGREPEAISRAMARKIGTYFPPRQKVK